MRESIKSEAGQQVSGLQQGDHLCLFYEKDAAEQLPVLIPFIQEGLSRDEQFIYVADDQTVDQLGNRLRQSGINVRKESAQGRLKLWTRKEWRQPGELHSAKKAFQVRRCVDEAAAAGFKGIRFAVEMTWTLGPDISVDQLEHWEATLNTIFVPGFPGRIVCQYNRSRLPPEVLMAALHTHPLAILKDQVCPNLFYRAPLILKGNGHGKASSATVEWMVSQLQRSRAVAQQHEELIQKRMALAETELARRQSEKSEALFRQLADAMPQVVWAARPDGYIDYFNRRWYEFTGFTDDHGEESWKVILHPDDVQRCNDTYFGCIRSERAYQIEHRFRDRLTGGYRWFLGRALPIRDASGEVVRWFGTCTDIDDQKRAEERLEKAVAERTAELVETNSQLDAFVYSIAHDLRAPLRSMQAFASMLLDDYALELDEKAQNYARRIVRSAESMDRLVLDLLAYGRVARSEIALAAVNVERVWAAALAQNEQAIMETKALVETISPLPEVRAHEATLAQVLANLLDNALKFVARGVTPRVRLWAEQCSEGVRLWVGDNGIGIALEHQERVFRIFERLNGKEYHGTGVGLSIVRKGVERMGGRIGLESKPGEGTRFWVELQLA